MRSRAEARAGGAAMKFMVEYETRTGSTHEETADNYDSLLKPFSNWQQPEGLTISAFVTRIDGLRGYLIVEVDDPLVLTRFIAQFRRWNTAVCHAVVDAEEAIGSVQYGLDWAKSAVG
jgi:hypothetical protein